MRFRPIILCALMLLALPYAAQAQSEARLKTSLTPFARDPMPSKNPFKAKGYDVYRGNVPGGAYVGASYDVGFMLQQMRSNFRPLALRWNALDSDLQMYDVDVNVTGGELVKKVDATTQAKLDALNKSIGSLGIMPTLQAYRLVKSKQAAAAKAEGAALQAVWAAIAEVDADAAVVRKQELVDEKSSLEARHKAIMAKVKSAAWLKEAFATAKSVLEKVSDPTKLTGYLVDKAVDFTVGQAVDAIQEALVSNVLIQHAQELHDIENRLVQVESAIKSASDLTIKKRLEASQAKLVGARLELVKAGIQRTVASVEGWDYIDALASIERTHKRTDVFQTLQQYNHEMRSVTRSLRANCSDYLSILNSGGFADAPRVLGRIEADVAFIQARQKQVHADVLPESSEFHPHLQQLFAIRNFTSHQADFYRHERRRMERYLAAITSETHLDLVDASVRQLLKTMGSTTDI